MRGACLVVVCLLGAASPAHAQTSPVPLIPQDSAHRDSLARLSPDSLAARLARAEADLALLKKQLAVENGTMVVTRSRLKLELNARVMTNAFANSQRVNRVEVPQYTLAPATVTDPANTPGTRGLGVSLRQTRFGAALAVDSVLGGTFTGEINFDLSGGDSNGAGDYSLTPEPRLRTASARLHWARTEVMLGSETPLISDLNPISLASVSYPDFATAGNLWTWLPQVRVTRELRGNGNGASNSAPVRGLRFAVQGALLDPYSGTQHVSEPDALDAANRSSRPFVEGRARVRWGSDDVGNGTDLLTDTGGEVGVGVHRGWLRAAGDSLSVSKAYSADVHLVLVPGIEVRGEMYTGQLLRGLGGGGIGQNFGQAQAGQAIGRPLRDTAGWMQLNVQPHTTVIAGVGCGVDVVNADDFPMRNRNQSCAAHVLWRPAQPLLFGFEFRSLSTRYGTRTYRGNHVNLSFGFEL